MTLIPSLNIYRKTIYATTTVVLVLLGWSFWGKLDLVATAGGAVMPSDYVKVLQNLEGGILTDIYVKAGDRVGPAQHLMLLSTVQNQSELQVHIGQQAALNVRYMRIKAEIDGTPFRLPEDLLIQAPLAAEGERREFEVRIKRREGIRTSLSLLEAEKRIVESLVLQGLEPKMEWFRVNRDYEEKLQSLNAIDEQSLSEFNKLQTEIQTKTEIIKVLKDKILRAQIVSPIEGVISRVFINTTGSVVKPGEPLIEVIPTNDELIVEAKLPAMDIANVRLGMKANVKLTAYDFNVFGSLTGTVIYISADTTKSDSGRPEQTAPYYTLRVKCDPVPVDSKKAITLMPGMEASVDVIIGERTIAEYFFRPIQNVVSNSLKGK